MVEHMLSTVDNPWSPFTHFDEWNEWDTRAGYHTLAFLGRIAVTSPDLSPVDESQAIEDAIDEIVTENVLGLYIKMAPNDKPRPLAANANNTS